MSGAAAVASAREQYLRCLVHEGQTYGRTLRFAVRRIILVAASYKNMPYFISKEDVIVGRVAEDDIALISSPIVFWI